MTSGYKFHPKSLHRMSWGFDIFFHIMALQQTKEVNLMKKNVLKSTKSIIFAIAVCAVAALGAFSAVSGSDTQEVTIVATHPDFIGGTY